LKIVFFREAFAGKNFLGNVLVANTPTPRVILFPRERIFENLMLFSREYYFPLEFLSIGKRVFFPFKNTLL